MPLINYKPEVYGQTAALDLEYVVLNPTWQDVAVKEWERVMKHPVYSQTVDDLIEEGALVVQEVQQERVSLDGYSKAAALKVIKDTYDEALLKRWTNETDVAAYQTAIGKQLAKFVSSEEETSPTRASKS